VSAASQKDRDITVHPSPYPYMAAQMVPDFGSAVQPCAQNQDMVNETLVVCALERYHLAHGEYPESLGALNPRFITAMTGASSVASPSIIAASPTERLDFTPSAGMGGTTAACAAARAAKRMRMATGFGRLSPRQQ
jgi:hypothetical protein